jgi:hypothetical protein
MGIGGTQTWFSIVSRHRAWYRLTRGEPQGSSIRLVLKCTIVNITIEKCNTYPFPFFPCGFIIFAEPKLPPYGRFHNRFSTAIKNPWTGNPSIAKPVPAQDTATEKDAKNFIL